MDEQLVATVEAEHDELQQSAGGVETQAELTGWALVVQIGRVDGMFGRVDAVLLRDAVLTCGLMDLHATCAQARTAARIASERLTFSRLARTVSASRSSGSSRTGTTVLAPAPSDGLPRRRSAARNARGPVAAASADRDPRSGHGGQCADEA